MNKKEKQLCKENTFSWTNKMLFELVQEARFAKTSGQNKSNQNKGLKLPSSPNKMLGPHKLQTKTEIMEWYDRNFQFSLF